MRVVTWNVRKASSNSPAWDYLLKLDPDVALIQDARIIPETILGEYSVASDQTAYYPGSKQQHLSAVLAKGEIGPFQSLPTPTAWMRSALAEWREYFTTRKVTLASGTSINVMSVYSLADPVPQLHWKNQETAGIQLPENSGLWGTELMWSILKLMPNIASEPWIVGGDLNASVSFDLPKPRGNQRILDRMAEIRLQNISRWDGLVERPTFRHARGRFTQQLDYLFANEHLSQHLVHIDVGNPELVLIPRPMLSDHLPIIADFEVT